jgi:DNA-binding NtrC family response regulator
LVNLRVVAKSGEAGLDAVRWGEKFAVIVSDMRMPGMDGATFLAKAREISPDSVRILLTGQADVQSSIAAINKGAIFRYLCKPCPKDELIATLNEAVRQYPDLCRKRVAGHHADGFGENADRSAGDGRAMGVSALRVRSHV